MTETPNITSRPSRSRVLAIFRRLGDPSGLRWGPLATLETRGNRTGIPHRITFFPIEVDGVPYVVSQYGTSGWVHNLRAAGRADVRRHGVSEPVTAVEVFDDERDRVIAAYLAKIRLMRRDYDQLPDNADHPTFRLEPLR